MKELSLNILDVSENSMKAGATRVEILINESDERLQIEIKDNGRGMTPEILSSVTDPFCTTRTTRKVGMGIPLFKLAAEQTGGEMTITSSTEIGNSGTVLRATFDTKSIDFMPVGDIISTICVLISGDPDIRFIFRDTDPRGEVSLDTSEIRAVLGDEISLAEPEVVSWISSYLKEQYEERENKNNIQ